jgi:hypothetical protein
VTNDQDLKKAERAAYLRSIAHRARKIAELAESQAIETQAPAVVDVMMGAQFAGLARIVVALCRGQAQAAMLAWLTKQIRGDVGLCVICGDQVANDSGTDLCMACLEVQLEIERELRTDLRAGLMEEGEKS